MFDFERLLVYNRLQKITCEVLSIANKKEVDFILQDQLKRASISCVLNLVEGMGRKTKLDRNRFLYISRGSIYETVAILELLNRINKIPDEKLENFKAEYLECTKMLVGLMRTT